MTTDNKNLNKKKLLNKLTVGVLNLDKSQTQITKNYDAGMHLKCA